MPNKYILISKCTPLEKSYLECGHLTNKLAPLEHAIAPFNFPYFPLTFQRLVSRQQRQQHIRIRLVQAAGRAAAAVTIATSSSTATAAAAMSQMVLVQVMVHVLQMMIGGRQQTGTGE